MRNEIKYLSSYNHMVITQTGHLEKELQHFREDFSQQNTKTNTLPSLKTEENINTFYDTHIDELNQKLSVFKLKVAELEEKMDNVNDDAMEIEKINKLLKEKIKLVDHDFEEIKKEKLSLKN